MACGSTLGRVVLLACALALSPTGSASAQKRAPETRAELLYSFAPVVKKAAPAVVNVYVARRVQVVGSPMANDSLFREFFGKHLGLPTERMQNSLGSGVIVTSDGVIVTNNHVIKGSGTADIRIVLSDKREFGARVLLEDPKTDLAVLKIDTEKPIEFAYLEFDDADAVEVGDIVLAIGNPFGVGQTVTQGIISAQTRGEIGRSEEQVFLQTDAAINPGNSGGALIDMRGRLVGINTVIYTQSGGSHGIGFAIPSNLARVVVESAISGRKLERPWLGARLAPVTREVAETVGLDRSSGALVERVYRGTPAETYGLRAGDVIISVDGKPAADPRAIMYRLTTIGVGGKARFQVHRAGDRVTIDLPLMKAPGPGLQDAKLLTGLHPLGGAQMAELSPAVADELGIEGLDHGLVVVEVRPGTPAARLGLRAADIVLTLNGKRQRRVADLEAQLEGAGQMWDFEIRRGDRTYQLRVPS
jgi:Do/DeqQ family serine protease